MKFNKKNLIMLLEMLKYNIDFSYDENNNYIEDLTDQMFDEEDQVLDNLLNILEMIKKQLQDKKGV